MSSENHSISLFMVPSFWLSDFCLSTTRRRRYISSVNTLADAK